MVIDAASCTNGLLDDVKNYLDDEHRVRLEQITLVDSITWCADLLPHLDIARRVDRVAVHPTCSMTHLGLTATLETVAGQLANELGTRLLADDRAPLQGIVYAQRKSVSWQDTPTELVAAAG